MLHIMAIVSSAMTPRAAPTSDGHFAAMRWETGGEALMPEVFVGGKGLERGPVDVLGTLLHEAGHTPAHARNVKDTSRQGRYHTQRYAEVASQLGLDVKQANTIGWSDTTDTTDTTEEQPPSTPPPSPSSPQP